ncbi:MAG: chromosome segregation protein SMC, partial [Bacteroidetes bacterium]|nr:chromosome segregation protein SMC [Bacteroidota bacterium]
ADKKWEGLFSRILNNTAVVDSLENMLEMSSKFSGFSFTTLDGDFVDVSGLVESGTSPQADNTLFGRMQLLEDLKKDFPVEEQKFNELSKMVRETESELNSIDLKILSDKGRILVNDLANVDKQIAQFEFEKKKADDEIESARKEIQILAQNSNKLDQEKIDLQEIINLQNESRKIEEESKLNLQNDFKDCESKYNTALNEKNNTRIEFEKMLAERKNVENAIGRAQSTIDTIDKNIGKRKSDINTATNEKTNLFNVIEQSQKKADESENVKIKLQDDEGEISSKYKSIQSIISEKEDKQNNLRKEREILTEEIHKSDLRLNEIEMKIKNLKEHIKENYSLSLEKKEFDDLDSFNFEEREGEVLTLKEKIKNLGPINLLAYSEYEEEKERFDFLNNQRNDLTKSEKDVIKTIEEINITAQQLFSDTFEKIRQNFTKIFGALFNPGDEADLRIEDGEDVLEAKIEIIAKPKGKRPTSIELLSGGEKTLTAIALLFSIYLVKPSPFCILDEIDAPLDDANIDRFNKILNDFSESTQFIVVTHNKRTMEAANTLYGVTMQEEGISKLVSVRFNEDFELTAN